tara:strand:+ start:3385 stop:4002 length:618 start_codon:yes stop_codon:yes gene_type:complete
MAKYNIYVAVLKPPKIPWTRWVRGINRETMLRSTESAVSKFKKGSFEIKAKKIEILEKYNYKKRYMMSHDGGKQTEMYNRILKIKEQLPDENNILLFFTRATLHPDIKFLMNSFSQNSRMEKPVGVTDKTLENFTANFTDRTHGIVGVSLFLFKPDIDTIIHELGHVLNFPREHSGKCVMSEDPEQRYKDKGKMCKKCIEYMKGM